MNKLVLPVFATLALAFTACGRTATPLVTGFGATLSGTSTGSGEVDFTLQDHKLTVSGTFTGLDSAATDARLFGPGEQEKTATTDLKLTIDRVSGTMQSGRITGTFTLTDQQIASLRERQMYVTVKTATPTSAITGVVDPALSN